MLDIVPMAAVCLFEEHIGLIANIRYVGLGSGFRIFMREGLGTLPS